MKRRIDDANLPAAKPLSIAWLICAAVATIGVVLIAFLGADISLLIIPLCLNGLVLLAWIAASAGIGMLVLRAFRIDGPLVLRAVIAIGLGLGILSLLTMSLGCIGILNRFSAIALIAIGCILALAPFRKPTTLPWDRLKKSAQWNWLFLALIPLLSIVIVCSFLPPGLLWGDEPNGYDVAEYHLQVPREWSEAGKILPLHHNVFSYFPFNVEMHYLLAMHLVGGPWKGMYLAQLMHASFIVLTVLAIYALLVREHPRGAILAGLFAGATPWLALLAPVAYNEGGLLFFGTLSIGLALKSLRSSRPLRWMLLAGAFAGFACGSKLTAAPMILLPLPVLIALVRLPLAPGEGRGEGGSEFQHAPLTQTALTLTLSRSQRGPEAALAIVGFWFTALIALSPWLIRDGIWTHNPVFPEATNVFGKAHWSDTQIQRWTRANHQPRPDQQNITGRFRALADQVLIDPRYGFILLPLGIIAAMLKRDPESVALLALLIVQGIFWLFFTHLQSRFFVLSIPIGALLIGQLETRSWQVTCTLLGLFLAIGSTFLITSKIAAFEHRLAGYQIRLPDLIALPSLRGFSRLPMSDDGKTVELVGEGQAFFYDIPMMRLYYRTVFDVDAKPGQTAEQAWRTGWPPEGPGVDVITNYPELERFHRTYFGIPDVEPQMGHR